MKHAKANITGKRRHAARPARATKSVRSYRVTAIWPTATGRPLVYGTQDKAKARKVARGHAADGAYVVIEEHISYGTYRVVDEIDGPALLARATAAERAKQEAADARVRAELAARAAQHRTDVRIARDRAQAAALMVQPPVPRTPAQRFARHTAGGR